MIKKICFVLVIAFSVLKIQAQTPEMNLGKGYKAVYTPPSGWVKGGEYNGTYTFYTSDSKYSISVNTKWIQDRTAREILDKSVSGLKLFNCKNESYKTDNILAEAKICEVNVGPRREGRIWMVLFYKDAMNAIEVEVLCQEMTPEMEKKIKQSIENIKYTDPKS